MQEINPAGNPKRRKLGSAHPPECQDTAEDYCGDGLRL